MANIIDVAKRAGVAISTVSNIINGKRYVSPETTEKVLRAIDELGYEIDPIARSMKGNRSNMIGMIITSFSRVFFAPILRQCREIAAAQGYTLMCIESNDDFELEQQSVDTMRKHRFDAIILDTVADADNHAYFEYLRGLSHKDKRIAVVCIERDASGYGLDSVEPDNYAGAVMATEYLLGLGVGSIAHITGPTNSWPAQQRVRGYSDCVARHNVRSRIEYGDFSPQSGYDAVKRAVLGSVGTPFDGIFASNDQMAIGAIKALKELQIRVPEEVGVVGFDDSFVTSLIEPSLTSVHVSHSRIGVEAMRMVLGRLENPNLAAQCQQIGAHLVVRKSTDPHIDIAQDFVNL